jgi:hypothetical protein
VTAVGPNSMRVTGISGRVPVDVVEVGKGELQAFAGKERLTFPGYGVSDAVSGYGTLWCLVAVPEDPGGTYLLSSAHVNRMVWPRTAGRSSRSAKRCVRWAIGVPRGSRLLRRAHALSRPDSRPSIPSEK